MNRPCMASKYLVHRYINKVARNEIDPGDKNAHKTPPIVSAPLEKSPKKRILHMKVH